MLKKYAPFFAPEDEGAGGTPAPSDDAPAPSSGDAPQPAAGDPEPADKSASDDKSDKSSDGDKKTALDPNKDKEPEGAPEQYEDFTIPEGVEIDKKAIETFQDVARELNLTQEQAQRLIDFQTQSTQQASDQHAQEWSDTVDGWLTEARDDKEIGGEKFDDNVEVAKRAIEKFGSPGLIEALNDFGIGNHPEFIRFAYKVGKTISEGDIVSGKSGQSTLSVAERLYPSMVKR